MLCAKFTVCPHDWVRPDFIPKYNKFYYICEGSGRITLDGKHIYPQSGQLFFAPAGIVQSFSVTNSSPFTMYWCHFTSNIELHPLFRSIGIPNLIYVDDSSRLLGYFLQLIDNSNQNGLTTTIKIQSALLEMVAFYIDHACLEARKDVNVLSINKLLDTIQYIDANLNKDMTIFELSQTVHFHPNYFIRFFKTHFGVSPMRYIYVRRMEKAKEMLLGSSMSIHEVAHLTGFHDASHFSTSFKKHVGVSPSEFRLYISAESILTNAEEQGGCES